MFKKLYNWCKIFLKKEKVYSYKFEEDVPDKFNSRTIYIISNDNFHWQVVMLCPCRCNKTLHMNLIKGNHPNWRFEIDKKKLISVYPSINRTVGCKSHFFIKKGKIIWA